MKITINGSAKELTELAIALSCMENEEKKADFPPLLTELAESENIDYIQSGCEIADTIKHTREVISSLKKMKDSAEQNEESAPQIEAAEQKKNQEILEKQMKLLSEASTFGAGDLRFPQNLSELTRAMIDLHKYQGRLS